MAEEIKQVMTAFEEFKAANDARLAEIEKKGASDVLLSEKIDRISTELDKHEEANQKRTLELLEAKKALDAEKAHVDELEVKLNRMAIGGAAEEKKRFHGQWLSAAFKGLSGSRLEEAELKHIQDVNAAYKAMNVSTNTDGGYLAPTEYVREIIKGVTEKSPVRSVVNVRSTMFKSIEVPRRTGTGSAAWVSETGARATTGQPAYGMIEIPTYELYAIIDITQQMIEDSAFNMEAEISEDASDQFAVAEGAAVISGDGSAKPAGLLDNSEVESISSGTAAGIADADGQGNGLMSLWGALKTPYARNATFLLNRRTLAAVRKLKDENKGYIWAPGLAGLPNTILGDPYVEMPDMPDVAANAYPIAYGDFNKAYTLVDRIAMTMLRDPFTQAGSGNVRYHFHRRLGGSVMLPEAYKLLKCAV